MSKISLLYLCDFSRFYDISFFSPPFFSVENFLFSLFSGSFFHCECNNELFNSFLIELPFVEHQSLGNFYSCFVSNQGKKLDSSFTLCYIVVMEEMSSFVINLPHPCFHHHKINNEGAFSWSTFVGTSLV